MCSLNPKVLFFGVGPAADCHMQFFSVRCVRWPGFVLIRVSCHCVVDVVSPDSVYKQHKVISNSNHCLFSEVPSVSTRIKHTRAADATHALEFEVSKCRSSQFAKVRMRMTPTLFLIPEGWMGLRERQPLVASLKCISYFFIDAGACGVAKVIYNIFVFLT